MSHLARVLLSLNVSDSTAVDKAMFLELPGLDRDLPLHCDMLLAGCRLSGVYMCSHTQASTERYTLPPTTEGSHHLPQGMHNELTSVFYNKFFFL